MKNLIIGLLTLLLAITAADLTKAEPKRMHHEVFMELGNDARAEWEQTCDDCGMTFTVHALVTGTINDQMLSLTYVLNRARTHFERSRRTPFEGIPPFSAEH